MDPIQALVTAGGAGVAIWVLKQFMDGKIHSDSEVQVHERRVEDLLKQIARLTEALEASNQSNAALISLWKALQSSEEEQ